MRRLLIKREFKLPGSAPAGLTWAEQGLWHLDRGQGALYCTDRETGGEIRRFECPEPGSDLCFDGQALWMVGGSPPRVRRIDPATGATQDERTLEQDDGTTTMTWAEGGPWIAGDTGICRLDPGSLNLVSMITAGGPVSGVTIAEESIWCTDAAAGVLRRLALPAGNELARFPLAGRPAALCFDGWLYWYIDEAENRLCAIRP